VFVVYKSDIFVGVQQTFTTRTHQLFPRQLNAQMEPTWIALSCEPEANHRRGAVALAAKQASISNPVTDSNEYGRKRQVYSYPSIVCVF